MHITIKPLFIIALGSIGQVAFKIGASSLSLNKTNTLDMIKNPYIITGLASYVMSTALYITFLKNHSLSSSYLMLAANYIIIPILSYFVFKEAITIYKIFGMMLIAFGVFLSCWK